jgi:Ser-tRNA(Ala) deacylase AlaX
MRRVFWDDPYQRTLTTKITSIEGNKILLEETIAFSFSGGQESDAGTINGIPIVDSIIENNVIYYQIQDGSGLHAGDEVCLQIDWARRYKLMRLHFAAELILELVTQQFDMEKIGAHIAEEKARIDFVYDKNISSIFEAILADYNRIIEQNHPIRTGFSDVENQRRYWEIDGFSKVPCGGTHVKSTAEVGFVKLKRKNIGSSKERIEISLMDEA